MLLKRLELLGFKSFANRSVLEFEPGISALVGPNGSGKSNVADAVRWVLGEQSARALRGRRPDEVIFVGSAGRHPLGMAEVALVFDNSSRRLALDFAEVRVARRLYRSGESEYLINGTRSRRKDLVALMLEAGLHAEGYTVIGQGSVEALVLQRPEERRGMLEHAADISRHQARLSEARGRLAATEQNLTRCRDVLAELEPRAKRLRLQAQKAELYVGKRAELTGLAESYYRAALSEQRIRQASAAVARDAASVICERLEREISQLEEVRRQARWQLDGADQELAELRSGADQLQQQRAAALRDLGAAQQRVASLRARIETLEAEVAGRAGHAAELRAELAASAEVSEAPMGGGPTDLEQLDERVNRLRAGLGRARAELAALEAERGQVSRARIGLERDLQGLRERAARERQARAEAERGRAAERGRLEAARASLEQVRAELLQVESRDPELAASLAASLAARQQAAAALAEARLAEQRARAELEVAGASLRELVGTAGEPSASGPGGGPTRRLAANLRLPPEFETAIGAALGEWAAALVVCDAERTRRALDGGVANRRLMVEDRSNQAADERLRRFEQQVDRALGDIWHRLPARLLTLEAGPSLPGLGPLAHTVVVRDFEAARAAAVRLAAGLAGAWQVATLDGRVITHHGGMAVGVERQVDRLVSQQRRQQQARERLSRAAQAAAAAEQARAAADEQLSVADAEERGAKDCSAAHRAELHLLGRRLLELEAASRQHAAALNGRTSTAPAQDAAEREGPLLERQRALEARAERLAEREAVASESARCAERDWEAAWAERELVRQRVERAMAELRSAQERRAAREAALERLDRERAQLCGQAAAARRDLIALEPTVAALEQALAEHQDRLEAIAGRVAARSAARQTLLDQVDRTDEQVSGLRANLLQARDERETLLLAAQQLSDELARTEAEMRSVAEEWGLGGEAVVQLSLLGSATGAQSAAEPMATPIDLAAARRRLLALQRELRGIGAVSDSVLEEYREVDERVQFLVTQSTDLEAAMAEVEGAIDELEKLMSGGFDAAFERVNEAFGQTFETLFGGGTARLVLTDPSDPLTTGVEIVAQPPGKRLQNLMSLSGGERALTSTALIFALLAINPLPFCVLDEVDAALDEANARRFAALLHQFSRQTQFIIVTHNRATMETAGSLYGVSMGSDGVTTVLSLRLGEALAHSRNGQDSRGSESILQA